MGNYFKPWRRKFGVLTLILACACLGLWVRSGFVGDFIVFSTKKFPFVTITSRLGVLECAWFDDGSGIRPHAQWNASAIRRGQKDKHLNEALLYWWGMPDVNSGGRVLQYGTSFAIRYVTIVVPLTLLCAWLLLSKVCVARPTGELLTEPSA